MKNKIKSKRFFKLATIGLTGTVLVSSASYAIVSCSCSNQEQSSNGSQNNNQNNPPNKTNIKVTLNENPQDLDYSGLNDQTGKPIISDFTNNPYAQEIIKKLGIFLSLSPAMVGYLSQQLDKNKDDKYYVNLWEVDQLNSVDKYMNYKPDPNMLASNNSFKSSYSKYSLNIQSGLYNTYNPFNNPFACFSDTRSKAKGSGSDDYSFVYGSVLFNIKNEFITSLLNKGYTIHDAYTQESVDPKEINKEFSSYFCTRPNDVSIYVLPELTSYSEKPVAYTIKKRVTSPSDSNWYDQSNITVFDLINFVINDFIPNEFSKNPDKFIDKEITSYCYNTIFGLLFIYRNWYKYFNIPQEHKDKVEFKISPVSRCDQNGNIDGLNKYTGFYLKTKIEVVVKDQYKDKFEIDPTSECYERWYELETHEKTFNDPSVGVNYTIKNAPVDNKWLNWTDRLIPYNFDPNIGKIASERLFYKYISTFSKLLDKYKKQYKYIDLTTGTVYIDEVTSGDPYYIKSFEGTTLNNVFWDNDSSGIFDPDTGKFKLATNSQIYSYYDYATDLYTSGYGINQPFNKLNIPNDVLFQESRDYNRFGYGHQYNKLSINIFSDSNIDYDGYQNDESYFRNVLDYYSYIVFHGENKKIDTNNFFDFFIRAKSSCIENLQLYLINWFPSLYSNFFTSWNKNYPDQITDLHFAAVSPVHPFSWGNSTSVLQIDSSTFNIVAKHKFGYYATYSVGESSHGYHGIYVGKVFGQLFPGLNIGKNYQFDKSLNVDYVKFQEDWTKCYNNQLVFDKYGMLN